MDLPVRIDHVDTRVRSIALVEPFYDRLMPALGWTRKTVAHVDADGEWLEVDQAHPYNTIEYYAPSDGDNPTNFIGFIEDPAMTPTRTRIAFGVTRAALEGWAARLRELGAKNVEPGDDDYAALFFEDPAGTRLELCARTARPPD